MSENLSRKSYVKAKKALNKLNNVVKQGKNLFNIEKALIGYYVNQNNGELLAFDEYNTSEMIEVEEGISYNFSALRKLAFYDLSKQYVSGVDRPQAPAYTYTAPADGYIRFSYQPDGANGKNVQMEIGSEPTAYEPYGYNIEKLLYNKQQEKELMELTNPGKTNIKVVKDGENFTLSSSFGNNKTITIETVRNGSLNDSFNWQETRVDGTMIHFTPDDITPIRTFNTVGGNHGYTSVVEIYLSGHDKTIVDLGSQWTDGSTTYTLIKIEGDNLFFGMPYTVTNGVINVPFANPVADLTHVQDATHTNTISIAGLVSGTQLYPSTNDISVQYILDGKEITIDGEYYGEELEIRERYGIIDYRSIINYSQANIGVSYGVERDNLPSAVTLYNTFIYRKGLQCTTFHSLKTHQPTDFYRCGFLQSGVIEGLAGYTRKRFMPNVLTKDGFDFANGVDLDAYATSLLFEPVDYVDPTIPPNHTTDWLYNSNGDREYGFSLGYVVDKTNSKNADRIQNSPYGWDMRSSKKTYPVAIQSITVPTNTTLSFMGFRNYLSPEEVGEATSIIPVKDKQNTYIYADFNQIVTGYNIPINEGYGKDITLIQSESMTQESEVVGADGVVLNTSNSPGNGIFKV